MNKKIAASILLLVLLITFPTTPANASNLVNTIDISAIVHEDGSISITQVWEGEFEEGTEVYIPFNAPDYLTLSDFSVSDQNKTYQVLQEWNIDADFEDKAGRCGIVTTDTGYEVCFGITQYGTNTYTISYTLQNAVASYTDMDGVNFRFVNDEMNTTPTDVTVEISLENGTLITDEICDIWAFGYDGEVAFEDGCIRAWSNKPVYSYEHVTIMFAFTKGILNPSRVEEDSFESVKEVAFQDSDYFDEFDDEDVSLGSELVIIFLCIGLPIYLIFMLPKSKKKARKKQLNKLLESQPYFRELPNGGDINVSYALGRLFDVCEDGVILGNGILRLIQSGFLIPVSNVDTGFMGKTKESTVLYIGSGCHEHLTEYDEYLYTTLEKAAGEDGVLQPKELERFARQNDTLVRNYIKLCELGGKTTLSKKMCVTNWKKPAHVKQLSEDGKKELTELLGFKHYLEDFSLIAERDVKELPIWRELMSYALLFGIGDKLAEQLKELYPTIATEADEYYRTITYTCHYYGLMHHGMREAESSRELAQRSSGSGGFSSFGGGGGSIGGGSGGGTR